MSGQIFETNILLGESVFFTEADRQGILNLCWEAFHESADQPREEFEAEFNDRWVEGFSYSMDDAFDLAYLSGHRPDKFTEAALILLETAKKELDAQYGAHDWVTGRLLKKQGKYCASCGAKIHPDDAVHASAGTLAFCRACEGEFVKDCIWVGTVPPTPDQIRALHSRHYRHRLIVFSTPLDVMSAAGGAELIVVADMPLSQIGGLMKIKQSNQTIIAPIMEWPHWKAGWAKPTEKVWSGRWEEVVLVSVVTKDW